MNPLKPVMAAILAAFSVMSLLPAPAFAAEAAVPKTAPTQAKDDSNALNILTELVAKDKKAQADVSERIQRLLLTPDFKGRSYVTPDLPKAPEAKQIPGLVSQWVVNHSSDAARLYFVARPLDGKVPEWVLSHPKGKDLFKDDGTCAPMPERLANHMAGVDQRADQPNKAGSLVGTVNVSLVRSGSLEGFLLGAVAGADVVLNPKVPCTPRKTQENIARNDTTAPQVPLGPSTRSPFDGRGSAFDAKALYEDGAFVKDVVGPKDPGYRKLSVKIYTTTDDKGAKQNWVGIVDITPDDPQTPYGPKLFPMDFSGQETFELRPGGRKYSMSLSEKDGQHDIVIKRPDSKEAGAGVISVSMEELAKYRLNQIADPTRGSIDIGGKQYYALGQGGTKGDILFFDKEEIDHRNDLDANGHKKNLLGPDFEPKAMATVSEVARGATRRVEGEPGPELLGKIGNKPYEPFHLEFDDTLKMWKVTKGPGTQPPAPPKEPAKPGKPPVGGAPSEGGAADPDPDEEKSLAEVVARLKTLGFKEPDPDGNEGFSDKMKKAVHILVSPNGKTPYCFILAPGQIVGNQACFPGKTKEGDVLVGIHGFGDYGAVEYKTSTTYFPLDAIIQKEGATHAGIRGQGGMREVNNIELALALLETHEKFSKEDLGTIGKRLKKRAKGSYQISFSKADKTVVIRNDKDKVSYQVWPDEREGEGDNAGMEGRKGPGTVVNLSFSEDAAFKAEMPFDATREMVMQKVSADGGTALYLLDDKAVGEKKWFVMVRATLEKDKTPSRSPHFQVFGTGKDWNALPDGYSIKGYATAEVPRSAKMALITVKDKRRGALCLYRTVIPAPGTPPKEAKENSVGPLVWWGADEAAAAKACQVGAFQ